MAAKRVREEREKKKRESTDNLPGMLKPQDDSSWNNLLILINEWFGY